MSTNTFERKLEINDVESLKKLLDVMNTDAPKITLSEHPFSHEERKKSDALLKQFLSHSSH